MKLFFGLIISIGLAGTFYDVDLIGLTWAFGSIAVVLFFAMLMDYLDDGVRFIDVDNKRKEK